MPQQIIPLETINSIAFLGVNNNRIQIIKNKYPLISIIARGNKIKIEGLPESVLDLSTKIKCIIQIIEKNKEINDELFEQIITDGIEEQALILKKDFNKDLILTGVNGKPIKARTLNQQQIVEAIEKNDIVFAVGPAGTGKTYTAVALAVKALKNKLVKKIILTRPAVEAGENLGFLPGDLKEKIDPYLRPLYDALEDMIPMEKINYYIENRVIEIAPLAFMRGRTLDNAFMILDEAQNTNELQLKMFLTRLGPNAKAIITGDPSQNDLPYKKENGLENACKILKNIDGIAIIYLNENDIVRHKLVKKIVQAYKKNS